MYTYAKAIEYIVNSFAYINTRRLLTALAPDAS